jgi:GDSL-like lipase/acylhydrolase family protein
VGGEGHGADGLKIFKIAAINFLILLLFAVIAELIFGNWLFGPDYGSLNVPRNVCHYYDVSNLYDGETAKYCRDEHGLRGDYEDVSNIGILTIGGSTTNQLYVDDGLTWQARLQREFQQSGRPLTVVDASVDGQSTRGHIAIFDRWLPKIPSLEADYVLAYVGINDIQVDRAEQWDSMESSETSRRLRYWVMNKSALYNLFRTVRGMFKAYNAKLVHGAGSPYAGREWGRLHRLGDAAPDPGKGPEFEQQLIAYEARLKTLVGRIRDFGAKAILVTQPTAEFRVRDGWIWVPVRSDGVPEWGPYSVRAAFNRVTLKACRETGAICVDIVSRVSFADGDFYDHVHNTPAGAKKLGVMLHEALKDRI